MSNVKKFNLGEINYDFCKKSKYYLIAFTYYTHELPLVSIGDVEHTLNLSLVFNYERYRIEQDTNQNPFCISPGFKLNVEKRLVYGNGIPTAFIDSSGETVDLGNNNSNLFTFMDDSERVVRRKPDGSSCSVEYPDLGRETFTPGSVITEAYNKYSDVPVLNYQYNIYGQMTAVILRNQSPIYFGYEGGRLTSITYNSKTSTFSYNADGSLAYVMHYTGVRYQFSMTPVNFGTAYVNFGYSVSAYNSYNNMLLGSKELGMAADLKTLEITEKNGSNIDNNIVNKVSYCHSESLSYAAAPFDYIDITDNNGVVTRVQIRDEKIFASYELVDGAPQFSEDTPQGRFVGNMTLYNISGESDDNRAQGVQMQKDGFLMNYNPFTGEWGISHPGSGYYIISGWIKANSSNLEHATIQVYDYQNEPNSFEVKMYPGMQWRYFCFAFNWTTDTIYTNAGSLNETSMRDVRITYQANGVLTDGNEAHINMSDDILIFGSNEIPIEESTFYYTLGGTDYVVPGNLTLSDIVRFKVAKRRNSIYSDVFYNKGKNAIEGATDIKVLHNGSLMSIGSFDIGVRTYSGGRKHIRRISINETHPTLNIIKRYTVNGAEVSLEALDHNFNVIASIVDGVTTNYTRNTEGIVTCETIPGVYRHDTVYDGATITFRDIHPTSGAELSLIRYYLDPECGTYRVEGPNGSMVHDTYDSTKSVVTCRSFDNESSFAHMFDYAGGRLTAISHNGLNYAFEYAPDTGELTSVIKNGTVIEEHGYNRSNIDTTVTENHPALSGASHSNVLLYDKYGRLNSKSDAVAAAAAMTTSENSGSAILTQTYALNPYWCYGENVILTSNGGYDRAQHGELSHCTNLIINKDSVLATSTDSLAGEVTKYGYDRGKLTAAVTYNTSGAVKRQETFTYDRADRVTKNRFYYNAASGEYIESDVNYLKIDTHQTVDNSVYAFTQKVNGIEKARTVNFHDANKRITQKTHTVGGGVFTKSITYDGARIASTGETTGVTTLYSYDGFNRIVSMNSGAPIEFVYDRYGNLVRENNKLLDRTFIYAYNSIGNVTSVSTCVYTTGDIGPVLSSYGLGYDTTHPDRLTSVGSESISYNALGYPMTFKGYTTTWTRGKLTHMVKGTRLTGINNYYFSYNAKGQRTSKSYTYTSPPALGGGSAVAMGMLIGYSYSFEYDNSGRLVYESGSYESYGEGSTTERIVYLYDEGTIIGLVYTVGGVENTYYFERNLLGDVIAIYNISGTKVAAYAYDAFGKCTVTQGTELIAYRNPIRYRGYYYDTEMNLYCLGARYYSPEWCRFISPDSAAYLNIDHTNGLNLYCYCNNDPVNYVDPSGRFAVSALLIAFGIGAVLGGVYGGISAVANDQNILAGIAIGAIVGGLTGLITEVASVPLMLLGTFAIGAAGDVASQMILDNKSFGEVNFISAAWAGVVNAGLAWVGKGLSFVDKMAGLSTSESIIFGTMTNSPLLGLGMAVNIGISKKSAIYTLNNLYYDTFGQIKQLI